MTERGQGEPRGPGTPSIAKVRAANGPRAGTGAVESPFRRLVSEFCESVTATIAFVTLVGIIAVAALAPWIAPQNPYDLAEISIMDSMLPPGSMNVEDQKFFWLGTDDQGRDILSAILYGLRITIGVGIVSGLIAFVIGTALGLAAAFFGGRVDDLTMRIVDLCLGFPAILVALLIVALLGRGIDKVIIALVVVQWAFFARAARGAALVERQREYVEAAACLAIGNVRIMFVHMLPNCLPSLIVVGALEVAHAVVLESTLSFLGLGLPITQPSLGLLISNGYHYMLSGEYWLSIYPGLALLIVLVSINLVTDQLRDVLNPRLRS